VSPSDISDSPILEARADLHLTLQSAARGQTGRRLDQPPDSFGRRSPLEGWGMAAFKFGSRFTMDNYIRPLSVLVDSGSSICGLLEGIGTKRTSGRSRMRLYSCQERGESYASD